MSKLTTLLTTEQTDRLDALETVIRDNMAGFLRVGMALREIREKRLYLATADTFPQYVKKAWDMGKSHAYRLIDAADVYENIKESVPRGGQPLLTGPDENTPNERQAICFNERQARELIPLKKDPELQQQAWETANERYPGKVTATRLKKIVKKLKGEKVADGIKNAKDKVDKEKPMPGSSFDANLWAAFDAFMKELVRVSSAGWVGCSRKDLLQCMVVIHDLIEDNDISGSH